MPSWHFLLALALFDSAFLIFAVLELSLPIPLDGQHLLISVHTRFVLFIRMFASAFYKASILIVVAFNVERYLYVCRPLWVYRSGILEKRAGCVVGLALVIGLLCSVQWPLAWRVVELECNEPCEKEEIENNCLNVNKTKILKYSIVVIKESLILQKYYRLMDWFSLFMFNLFPILLLAYLNIQLMQTLRHIVRRDSSVSANFLQQNCEENNEQIRVLPVEIKEENQQNNCNNSNANAMLFAVVLLLFVCIGPQAAARLLYEWHGIYHLNSVLYTCITQQLVFLNASLNFCLYCLVSRRYRLMLKETINRLLHCNFKIIIKSEGRCLQKTKDSNENNKKFQLILQNNTNSNSNDEQISFPLMQMNKFNN
uniref:G-protein coupled receptors family 1 profile domain-containing protein n=2 Tax=Meloidogyne enterolobii TaxID=390850 RepID=A0A6V7U195_MELEN|nr:unnamed protein product [Meloidogyne enterolobii]